MNDSRNRARIECFISFSMANSQWPPAGWIRIVWHLSMIKVLFFYSFIEFIVSCYKLWKWDSPKEVLLWSLCHCMNRSTCSKMYQFINKKYSRTDTEESLRVRSLNSWMSCRCGLIRRRKIEHIVHARFQWRCFTLCTRMTTTGDGGQKELTKNVRFVCFLFLCCWLSHSFTSVVVC